MGQALEVIHAQVVAPGSAAYVNMPAVAGDTLAVRSADLAAGAQLLQAWMDAQGNAGVATFRVRSPRLHDNVRGLTADVVPSEVDPQLPWGITQRLVPQDLLVVEGRGSATAGDVETVALLVYYPDLSGVNARLSHWAEIQPRVVNITSVENVLAVGVAGGYSGQQAINASMDLLKANTDYALLGYTVQAECASVCWRGVDTGNLRVGGPGNELDHQLTIDWFRQLSDKTGLPTIPIFNSANKAGILLDAVQDENGAAVTVISYLAELS